MFVHLFITVSNTSKGKLAITLVNDLSNYSKFKCHLRLISLAKTDHILESRGFKTRLLEDQFQTNQVWNVILKLLFVFTLFSQK